MKHTLNRRHFVASSLGLAALLELPGVDLGDEPAAEPVVDTHTHFYDPTRPQGVPWPGKDDKVLYRRVLPKDFKAVAGPHGVTGTVVVEASPWVEDNQWLLDLAKDEPVIVGVVGNLRPGEDDFAKHLKRFAKDPLFRGIRINAADLKKGLEQRGYVEDLKRLADHDLALDVNGGPEMPAEVARLADKVDALRVVINHAANLPIDGKAVPAGWLAGMRAAAGHERVSCKVSALVEATGKTDGKAPKEVAFYRPVLDALWEAFGEERLLYGSNWPVSERCAPYAVVYGIVAEYVAPKGKAAAAKVFGRNSRAAYRWVKR